MRKMTRSVENVFSLNNYTTALHIHDDNSTQTNTNSEKNIKGLHQLIYYN